MNRSFHRALPGLALVALLILLAACAAPVAPAIDEGAPAAAPAATGTEIGMTQVVYDLPDLAGQTIVAAMANDYTPFQFIDPASGEAVGWEYDAMHEICRRLNCVVDFQKARGRQ